MSVASRATGLSGRRFGALRPDLVVVDEVEGVGARFKPVDLDWMASSVIAPCAPGASIMVVGTLWNDGSVIEELLGSEDVDDASAAWWGRRYKAILGYPCRADLWIQYELVFHGIAEFHGRSGPSAAAVMVQTQRQEMAEGAQLLWPDRTEITELLQCKVKDGWWRFDAAYQNRPQAGAINVIMDLDGRPRGAPHEWSDDAGLIRNSYQDDYATGRVLFPSEADRSREGWETFTINNPGGRRKPRKELIPHFQARRLLGDPPSAT